MNQSNTECLVLGICPSNQNEFRNQKLGRYDD